MNEMYSQNIQTAQNLGYIESSKSRSLRQNQLAKNEDRTEEEEEESVGEKQKTSSSSSSTKRTLNRSSQKKKKNSTTADDRDEDGGPRWRRLLRGLLRHDGFRPSRSAAENVFLSGVLDVLRGEWMQLTLLGIVVAIFSFIMDIIMEKCVEGRSMLLDVLSFSLPLQFFVWVSCSVMLVCFAVGFTQLVGPFAVGSGIPEVKTIMQGNSLPQYLTLRTLMAKVVGLSTALGSGLPIGKEGPFVHVAGISASLISKLFSYLSGKMASKEETTNILVAACAVGVGCTFAAPVGGVLFSIEVTATYFTVRNYWRGFYSAFVGALFFRLLAIWFQEEVTLTAYFRTNLQRGTVFLPQELLPFTVVGVFCGFGGVLFIFAHKRIVLLLRNNRILKSIVQTNRFIYPVVVTVVVMSLFYPPGFGQYMGGPLTNPDAVRQLFNNVTWSTGVTATTNQEDEMLMRSWHGSHGNVFLSLTLFVVVRFLMCAVATTLPIPAGIFIPSFALGAGLGRLIGEVMAFWFPGGFPDGRAVIPAGYAIVGAAAFAGSVTHTVSTVVIVFEMTGQTAHVIPSIVAVLTACFISKRITLSLFDVIVEIKKLPFLHGFIRPNEKMLSTVAKDFMIRDVDYLTASTTYRHLSEMLEYHLYATFPVVLSADNRILLGAIDRSDIERLMNEKFPRNTKLRTGEEEEEELRRLQQRTKKCSTNNNQFTQEEEEGGDCRLSETADLSSCPFDPAPFQLVGKTSLYKVYKCFSRLSLQHAFVTKDGRLTGIISGKEVREALDRAVHTNTADSKKEKTKKLNLKSLNDCCCSEEKKTANY